MRVLHAISEMGVGGAESLVVELVRRGAGAGWESAVASNGGPREDELQRERLAATYRVPLSRRSPGGLARAGLATRRVLVGWAPDVVVAHNVGVTASVALARRTLRRRIPTAAVFHGVAAGEYRTAARILDLGADEVVTVSEAIARRLADSGLRRRPVVIPNAVTAPAMPSREDARRALGIPLDVPVALCAARLVEQKRHDVLLRAWSALPEGCQLLIAGDGPQRSRLSALHEELGLGGSVQLLGSRGDVPRLLAAADVATLSSDWEGLPIFVLEAMASGRPVVATRVDGLAEVLSDGGGLLVPPGSPSALAEALGTMLLDPRARADAAAAALRTVERRYNAATMVARYDDLLRGLHHRGPQPAEGAR